VSPTGIRVPGGEENGARALDARPVAVDLTALCGEQAAFPTASVPLDRFKLPRASTISVNSRVASTGHSCSPILSARISGGWPTG
jgi:hypothetical protein